MDIFSDPLGFTSSSPRFGPYRSTDFSDDRYVGAPSLLSSLRSHRDELLEIRQSRRKRPRRSYSDSEGSEEVAFTDDEDDLVLAGERTERVLTLSPTRFESGSSVFLPKRKQPTIPFSHGFFALSFWDIFRALQFRHSTQLYWLRSCQYGVPERSWTLLTVSVDFR